MSFFIVPLIGTGTRTDQIRPKYIGDLGVTYAHVPFGASTIVWADTTPTQDSSIGANPDAVVVPPLDTTISSGALATVRSTIEALSIPANWITAGMSYRSVLRVLVGMAQLIQRTTGILGFTPTVAGNLDKTINQLPSNVQTALASAVDSLGLDRTNITGTTTLRAALLDFGQQWVAGRSISLGDL